MKLYKDATLLPGDPPSYPSGYLMLPNLTNQFSLSYPMAIFSANEIRTLKNMGGGLTVVQKYM